MAQDSGLDSTSLPAIPESEESVSVLGLPGEDLSSEEDAPVKLDSHQLAKVLEDLNQFSGWQVYPAAVAELVTSAVKLLRRGPECVPTAWLMDAS